MGISKFTDTDMNRKEICPQYNNTEGRVESAVLEFAILLGEGARLTAAVDSKVLDSAPDDPILLPHL